MTVASEPTLLTLREAEDYARRQWGQKFTARTLRYLNDVGAITLRKRGHARFIIMSELDAELGRRARRNEKENARRTDSEEKRAARAAKLQQRCENENVALFKAWEKASWSRTAFEKKAKIIPWYKLDSATSRQTYGSTWNSTEPLWLKALVELAAPFAREPGFNGKPVDSTSQRVSDPSRLPDPYPEKRYTIASCREALLLIEKWTLKAVEPGGVTAEELRESGVKSLAEFQDAIATLALEKESDVGSAGPRCETAEDAESLLAKGVSRAESQLERLPPTEPEDVAGAPSPCTFCNRVTATLNGRCRRCGTEREGT